MTVFRYFEIDFVSEVSEITFFNHYPNMYVYFSSNILTCTYDNYKNIINIQ